MINSPALDYVLELAFHCGAGLVAGTLYGLLFVEKYTRVFLFSLKKKTYIALFLIRYIVLLWLLHIIMYWNITDSIIIVIMFLTAFWYVLLHREKQ